MVRLDRGLQQVGSTYEVGHEAVGGLLVHLLGRAHLQQPTRIEDRQPVAHGERLLLVVGDEHEGDAHLALQALQFHLHALAQLQVERAERLVEQQHLGPVHQRPGQRHALLLPARQLVRAPPAHVAELHELEGLGHSGADLVAAHLLHAQTEADVVGDGHVGEQRVVLEHGVDRALVGQKRAHVVAKDPQAAVGGEVEPGDHAQRRGLAAARRAEQGEELAVADGEVEAVDGGHLAEALGDAVDLHGRYRFGHAHLRCAKLVPHLLGRARTPDQLACG